MSDHIRQLRKLLKLSQTEMGALGGCSKYMILRIEHGREQLSASIARRLAEATGISAEWLMADDDSPPVNDAGEPYTISDRERVQLAPPSVHDTAAHHYFHEAQLGVAFDLMLQILAADRVKRTSKKFMDAVEMFIKDHLGRHPALKARMDSQRLARNERALKEGRLMALGLLSPTDPEPFKRGREKLARALAIVTAAPMRREK
jgi:transcriptional regulator with XRE-family HTH domain